MLLGFVGLPTLGFHLESAFREGRYHEAGALLWLFYLLIGSIGLWSHRRLIPWLLLASLFVLGPSMLPAWLALSLHNGAAINIAVDALARHYRSRDVVMDDPCSR